MDTKLRLISLLDKNRERIHLRGISRALNTGLPNVKRYADLLEKEKVITKKKDANLVKLSLNNHPRTIAYLKQIHTESFLSLSEEKQKSIQQFINNLPKRPLVVMFDSSSDRSISIVLVYEDNISSYEIESFGKALPVRIFPTIINRNEFENKFFINPAFKEIRNTSIVIRGTDFYYEQLWRWLL